MPYSRHNPKSAFALVCAFAVDDFVAKPLNAANACLGFLGANQVDYIATLSAWRTGMECLGKLWIVAKRVGKLHRQIRGRGVFWRCLAFCCVALRLVQICEDGLLQRRNLSCFPEVDRFCVLCVRSRFLQNAMWVFHQRGIEEPKNELVLIRTEDGDVSARMAVARLPPSHHFFEIGRQADVAQLRQPFGPELRGAFRGIEAVTAPASLGEEMLDISDHRLPFRI